MKSINKADSGNREDEQSGLKQKKSSLRMHAIKCKCGDILGANMQNCPGCGISIEALLEALRQDFYRIHYGRNPKQ